MSNAVTMPPITVQGLTEAMGLYTPASFAAFSIGNVDPGGMEAVVNRWLNQEQQKWNALISNEDFSPFLLSFLKDYPEYLKGTLLAYAYANALSKKSDNALANLPAEPFTEYYTPGDRFSGGVTTPIAALAHFIYGDGVPRSVAIGDLGLNVGPKSIPGLVSLVNQGASPGAYMISESFAYNTANDSKATGSYPGFVTLQVTGQLTVGTDRSWNFSGALGAKPDLYDANPSTHRSFLGEASTWILDQFGGTPYRINIESAIDLNFSQIDWR